ncbi:hypothetical protein HID58_023082 [Brassica napus]|uniref:Uncharacterized protein n=1 Tax=Brassica napus TaxID=3708 RepID=A0ABQ8D136_BRANA|nr:hypothetical protein HID58_023082 [Brassica napus]
MERVGTVKPLSASACDQKQSLPVGSQDQSESPVVIVLSGFKVCIIMYGDTFSVAGRDIPIVRRVIKINHIVSLSVLSKTQLQAFNNIKLNISSGEK